MGGTSQRVTTAPLLQLSTRRRGVPSGRAWAAGDTGTGDAAPVNAPSRPSPRTRQAAIWPSASRARGLRPARARSPATHILTHKQPPLSRIDSNFFKKRVCGLNESTAPEGKSCSSRAQHPFAKQFIPSPGTLRRPSPDPQARAGREQARGPEQRWPTPAPSHPTIVPDPSPREPAAVGAVRGPEDGAAAAGARGPHPGGLPQPGVPTAGRAGPCTPGPHPGEGVTVTSASPETGARG